MSAHSDYNAAITAVNTALTTIHGLLDPTDSEDALKQAALAEANQNLNVAKAVLETPGGANRAYKILTALNI